MHAPAMLASTGMPPATSLVTASSHRLFVEADSMCGLGGDRSNRSVAEQGGASCPQKIFDHANPAEVTIPASVTRTGTLAFDHAT